MCVCGSQGDEKCSVVCTLEGIISELLLPRNVYAFHKTTLIVIIHSLLFLRDVSAVIF